MSLGFGFHSSKKWQAARAAISSILVFLVVVNLGETPGIRFAAGIFLVFSLVLAWIFIRTLRERFVLELTETHLVDRRCLRAKKISYSDIEIFSPKPEAIFSPEPKIVKIRESFGLRDHIDVACRLRGDGPDFVFSDRVAMPTPAEQEKIIARLRAKIAIFDNLYSDLGDDVGGDASEFDETQS